MRRRALVIGLRGNGRSDFTSGFANSCEYVRRSAPQEVPGGVRGSRAPHNIAMFFVGTVQEGTGENGVVSATSLGKCKLKLCRNSTLYTSTSRTCTGSVRAEHAYSGTSWGALTLEVGKSPTATRWRAELPVVQRSAICEFDSSSS
eukprot:scaffold641_cov67-Phaeocystis_antarctica.AAC.1